MTIEFDTSEVRKIAALLKAAPDEVADAVFDAGLQVAERVRDAARQKAPKDRPWLSRAGIQAKAWRDGHNSHADIFTVPDPEGRPVGFFVEYGTSDTPPQPFLSPQMRWAAPAFRAAVTKALDPLDPG